jgi:ACS family sodium-dependent inorganic phosphate cotransporter
VPDSATGVAGGKELQGSPMVSTVAARVRSWHGRYAVVIACSFAVLIAYADRVNISVAAVAMQQDLGWTDSEKGTVLAAFFFGYVLMQVVGGWLSHKYGGERVLIASLIFWSLCTVLTPLAAHASFALLLIARIGLGLGEGPLTPAVFSLFARHVPPEERGRSTSVWATSGHVGTVLALVSTGFLVVLYGWESTFYVWGVLGLLYSAILPRLLGGLSPRAGAASSEATGAAPSATGAIPWGLLLRARAFLALAFSFFCACWVFYVLLLWMPSYFSRVHGMAITVTGLYSLTPWLVLIIAQNLAGWAADTLARRGVSTTIVRKIFVVAGLGGASVVLSIVPSSGSALGALLLL